MRFAARRRICQVTFCALCLLPTLLIGGAAVVVNTPGYHAAKTERWRSQLAARLGLEVAFSHLDRTDQERYAVRKIELRDPESHAWLARARSVSIERGEHGLLVTLGQPEVDAQRLPRLIEILHEHLLLRSDPTSRPIQLTAATLVVQGEPRIESLLAVRMGLDVSRDATELLFEFQPAGAEDSELVRMRVVRNRQLDPPATGWELHTGTTALPCQLARAWLPQLDLLGASCAFQGSLWSEHLERGWEADVSGVFHQLDLDCLVTSQFPHKLSGLAQLTVARMKVRRGRVAEIRGQLESDGGVVSQTLLTAAEQQLTLKQYAPATEAMLRRYQDLSLDFSLDDRGLTLAGRDDLSHTILADSQGPLLTSQGAESVPPQAVVRALVPLVDLQVPVTKETTALLLALPLPAVTPGEPTTARRDYSPLKLLRE